MDEAIFLKVLFDIMYCWQAGLDKIRFKAVVMHIECYKQDFTSLDISQTYRDY